jgi:KilA-N domain
MSVVTFKFNENEITFDFNNENLKVNATQMAKAFGKDVPDFTGLKGTKEFIVVCLNNRNHGYLKIESEADLIESKQKEGTWMHRILALKFAAWLDPEFELWIYSTIDKLIFGEYHNLKKSLKESANRKNKIESLRDELREADPRYISLEQLELEERQATYGRGKFNRSQIELFKDKVTTPSDEQYPSN